MVGLPVVGMMTCGSIFNSAFSRNFIAYLAKSALLEYGDCATAAAPKPNITHKAVRNAFGLIPKVPCGVAKNRRVVQRFLGGALDARCPVSADWNLTRA